MIVNIFFLFKTQDIKYIYNLATFKYLFIKPKPKI